MKMEFHGGLTADDILELNSQLAEKEFTDIIVSAPLMAKFGETMELFIKVKYTINTISGIFSRDHKEYLMEYRRLAVARKVIN